MPNEEKIFPKINRKKIIKKYQVRLDFKRILLYLLLIFLGISFFFSFARVQDERKEIPFSQVLSDVKNDKVQKIEVEEAKLTVKYKDEQIFTSRKEEGSSVFEAFKAADVDPKKVEIEVKDTSSGRIWFSILGNFLPLLLMVLFFLFLFRQARGAQESIFSFGQSRAKLFSKDTPRTTFADVAGVDEAKKELTEVVDFLKNPGKYRALGARTPKGLLLLGPPGVGKTLLARALAGEAGVPFFSMAGSEFMEMLVGVGASRVRDLFSTAKKNAPAIIFIDEIESIGRARSPGGITSHDEREQTLNQILVEMDGFEPNTQIIVAAATNRPDLLDSALLRPGRFDRRITLDLPDIEGRKAILKIHQRGKPMESAVDWEKVAKRTVGFSGADLENMLNEAAILAASLNKTAIDMSDLEEAATKVKLGPQKKRIQSDLDKKMTAYHEAGHAIVTHELPHMDPVHRISIVSRGFALGFTLIPPTQDRYTETRSRLLEQIASLLGGRAAEKLEFNELTAGAASDIQKATDIARAMVIEYGMSDLGPVSLGPQYGAGESGKMWMEPSQVSPEMASKVDSEVKKILDDAYERAEKILKHLKTKLDMVSRELLEKETLEGDEFEKLMKDGELEESAPVEKKLDEEKLAFAKVKI
ncbi:ATP-dependent metallopeptidase FtsH/Yme1/Tma family protein [Candidatus Microgenomates bacterium]|nr:ATP-dependent metallopeptidase FtsH/Yme1/Tma family protein [Candidatus Microgenomates bacterium]